MKTLLFPVNPNTTSEDVGAKMAKDLLKKARKDYQPPLSAAKIGTIGIKRIHCSMCGKLFRKELLKERIRKGKKEKFCSVCFGK